MGIDKNKLTQEVIKLKNGDGKAFENIYNMTNQASYFTVYEIVKNEDDVYDVLQESYITLLDKINTLENPEAFTTWFNRILANKSKNYLRSQHLERYRDAYFEDEEDNEEKSLLDFAEDKDEEFIPESSMENTELRKEVMKMIENLSDEKRAVVILFYYNNLTTRDIAESLGVNENTVKSRLVQAKKDLAKAVKEYESKHGKLLGVAPMPLTIWALKSTAATTAMSSGAAASTLAAITAGTAAGAGAAAAGTGAAVAGSTGIASKIIAAVIAATIIGGGTFAGTRIAKKYESNRKETTTVSDTAENVTERPEEKNEVPDIHERYGDVTVPEDKNVDTLFSSGELDYGLSYSTVDFAVKDGDDVTLEDGITVINRKNYSAEYSELIPAARKNMKTYSAYINDTVKGINSARGSLPPLKSDSGLTEQASARAEEIAASGYNYSIRPDGSSYTTVFDESGLTSGTRIELRAAGCSNASDALEQIKKDSRLQNTAIEYVGVGVAKDPQDNKLVFVVHLYSETPSVEDEKAGILERIDYNRVKLIDNIIDFNQNISDESLELNEEYSDDPLLGYDVNDDELYRNIIKHVKDYFGAE